MPSEVNESRAEILHNHLLRTYKVRYQHASPLGPLWLRDENGEIVEDVVPDGSVSMARIWRSEQTLRRMDIRYNV